MRYRVLSWEYLERQTSITREPLSVLVHQLIETEDELECDRVVERGRRSAREEGRPYRISTERFDGERWREVRSVSHGGVY